MPVKSVLSQKHSNLLSSVHTQGGLFVLLPTITECKLFSVYSCVCVSQTEAREHSSTPAREFLVKTATLIESLTKGKLKNKRPRRQRRDRHSWHNRKKTPPVFHHLGALANPPTESQSSDPIASTSTEGNFSKAVKLQVPSTTEEAIEQYSTPVFHHLGALANPLIEPQPADSIASTSKRNFCQVVELPAPVEEEIHPVQTSITQETTEEEEAVLQINISEQDQVTPPPPTAQPRLKSVVVVVKPTNKQSNIVQCSHRGIFSSRHRCSRLYCPVFAQGDISITKR